MDGFTAAFGTLPGWELIDSEPAGDCAKVKMDSRVRENDGAEGSKGVVVLTLDSKLSLTPLPDERSAWQSAESV